MSARQEGQPRPAVVNESELPKKPLKRFLARTVNCLTDLTLITIFGGAVTANGSNNEAISPMPKSQKISVVK